MKRRDRFECCGDSHSWPPVWWWRGGGDNNYPNGEVGILKQVLPWIIEPANRFYLIMEYEGAEYLGVFLFHDYAVCKQVYNLMLQRCGQAIKEIGNIDLRDLL